MTVKAILADGVINLRMLFLKVFENTSNRGCLIFSDLDQDYSYL